MTLKLMRCAVCQAVIDPDDPDYSESKDHPELCEMCNEVSS